jgi:hypothetical protein
MEEQVKIPDIKINVNVAESAEEKEFNFVYPQGSSFADCKKATIGAYEHLTRVEFDAFRAEMAKKEAEAKAKDVTPELVLPEMD